ncbi:MAG: threonine synthase [Miltoncostaeaceae bacterium]|nr:threonine synthase [Miltoncostaeaceae bacterium]
MIPLIERYRDFLPVGPDTPIVSLGEGNTPLVPLPRLGERLGVELYAKFEGMNPTGSFKDRGMTMAVTKAVEEGAEAVICASTGNTSASAAAYAARAGLRAAVVVPEGKIAAGKLAQALAHGARVIALDGGFDEALAAVRQLVERHNIALVNSLNEYRIDGQRTGAFEICDEMGDAPDVLCIPVGNAGNVSAYWLGFQAYREAERSRKLPRLYGFQAAGAAPLVRGRVVPKPETVAPASRIGNPARGPQAMTSMRDSGGGVAAVTDDEILEAYRLLSTLEGVFCEPASAASIAGAFARAKAGDLKPGEKVVCVLTGHGLKDPATAIESGGGGVQRLPADLGALEEAVFG